MPVIGNQGGGGLVFDATVNVQIATSTYTVPANRVFKGHVVGDTSAASNQYFIGAHGRQLNCNQTAYTVETNTIELGAGNSISTGFGNIVRIYGALYRNA